MNRDQAVGASLLAISVIVIVVYGYLVFLSKYAMITLEVTAFLAVLVVFAILGWIGYTLATTPPPKPIEEIEKEIEEELKKLEEELKESESTETAGASSEGGATQE